MITQFNKQMTSFIISFAMFMEGLDATIINTAIPNMAEHLRVPPIDLKIALISYLLSLAIFIPISGWMADKFGGKRVFIAALAIFTVSSLWCGFSRNLHELVIARVFQGIGGSFALPVGRLIILRTFPREQYLGMMNRVVMVATVGMMLGPVLGGFITHYFSWPWIFFVNVPIGIIAIIFANHFLIEVPKQPSYPLDKLGFILFGLSLATFTFGLSAFSETYISNKWAVIVIASSILLFFMYLAHSRKQAHPIINKSLLKLRTFQISLTGNLVSRLGFGGVPFLVPLLLQIALSYPAQISGLLLAPTALGIFISKPISLFLLRRFGYKRVLILNTLITGIYLSSLIVINVHTSVYFIGTLSLIFGLLMSMQYSGLNSLAYAEASPENLSSMAGITITLQQLSQSFGVAVSALFIRAFSSSGLNLDVNAFHHTFMALGITTLLSTLVFIRLKPNDGEALLKKAQ